MIEIQGLNSAIRACVDEGLIMQKGRRFPIWLTRRAYFKRLERWAKPGKARKPAPPSTEIAPAMLSSNVVPFPIHLAQASRPAFPDLRGVGIG
ncbi:MULTISPECIES: hypothetical protein [unclassified Methylobacterium]|uniref:hypothetical protein n=1 Tax=unclassified Methylobacterium TaxID=2615210 RepID=UPI001FEDD890|nr:MULTISPECIES: hypothetical protein [unclassified Methylobacterium]